MNKKDKIIKEAMKKTDDFFMSINENKRRKLFELSLSFCESVMEDDTSEKTFKSFVKYHNYVGTLKADDPVTLTTVLITLWAMDFKDGKKRYETVTKYFSDFIEAAYRKLTK